MNDAPPKPRPDDEARAMAEAYDERAEANGWLGPEVAFGLAYRYVRPGQSILDIGIGTGLGSVLFRKAGLRVYGMDVSQEMLGACRIKGFTDLTRHDLTEPPYPYDAESLDHVVCVGVLQFFKDLSPVFEESARILRKGGLFVFVVGDRTEDEAREVMVGAEHTNTGAPVTMYRQTAGQVGRWVGESGFMPLRTLAFPVHMDRNEARILSARAYLVQKPASPRP